VGHHAGSSSERRWQKFASKRLRFASNVAEFTVAGWAIGGTRTLGENDKNNDGETKKK
jgi:hypothetical protein